MSRVNKVPERRYLLLKSIHKYLNETFEIESSYFILIRASYGEDVFKGWHVAHYSTVLCTRKPQV